MRIRFFNTYEPVSTHYRDLVPYLAANGVDVEIVVSKAEYRRGRNLREFMASQPNVRLVEAPSWGLRVEQGAIAKAIITVTYLVTAMVYGLFGPGTDKNVFLTQPPLISVLGLILRTVRRQPYDCIMMDVYPQIAVAMGLMQADTWQVRRLKQIAMATLRHANGVIVIGRCMRDLLIKNDVPADRIHYVPNWADHDAIYPVGHTENGVRRDFGWQEKFVILYAGNIGFPQYFDDLLQAANDLRDRPEVLFAFIGSGSRAAELQKFTAEHHLTNVIMLPFLHEEYSLADILSAGDVHFVTLREGIGGLAVPSKTYGILAAGRPLLFQGDQFGEIARMINEERIGEVIPTGNPDALVHAIDAYLTDPTRRATQGRKARQLATHEYGRSRALREYQQVLMGAVEQPTETMREAST